MVNKNICLQEGKDDMIKCIHENKSAMMLKAKECPTIQVIRDKMSKWL